ncbi:hypothetical protein RKE38_10455 [Phycicoccus sp. M110.8]|uniref:hypothetical protein n=1 Tax=Phycicoccus sp. M110.8 TaxID=3075433 RepID=UPI0028FD655A|nr:hypothetical protein [Phycicoccus sp. M110.8]MDU0314106.1 hypothetical protein [Phycicoccus sp. M110.8]
MTAVKMYPFDPDIGSPVFNEYTDPAMADRVVHFVGRRRGNTLLPANVRHLSAQERLTNILTTGGLHGYPVYRSDDVAVTCASDLCSAELETAFAKGLNSRGPLEPWALVLDRPTAWTYGFRPVVYADAAVFDAHKVALNAIHGPGGSALAVRTELGRDDWTAEREWRKFFPPGAPPLALDLRGTDVIAAVIVGQTGWAPALPWTSTSFPPMRWLWDAAQRRLVHDGRIPFRP